MPRTAESAAFQMEGPMAGARASTMKSGFVLTEPLMDAAMKGSRAFASLLSRAERSATASAKTLLTSSARSSGSSNLSLS